MFEVEEATFSWKQVHQEHGSENIIEQSEISEENEEESQNNVRPFELKDITMFIEKVIIAEIKHDGVLLSNKYRSCLLIGLSPPRSCLLIEEFTHRLTAPLQWNRNSSS